MQKKKIKKDKQKMMMMMKKKSKDKQREKKEKNGNVRLRWTRKEWFCSGLKSRTARKKRRSAAPCAQATSSSRARRAAGYNRHSRLR